MPQNHQLYYPTSVSPTTHQIYGNVLNSNGFSNFGYSSSGWPHTTTVTGDYGLFQGTYHYQPTEYIPLINNDQNYAQSSVVENKIPSTDSIYHQNNSTCNIDETCGDKSTDTETNNNNNKNSWRLLSEKTP